MKIFKKIIGLASILSVLMLSAVPAVMAQSALDDIKSKLEGEGISVVDFSTSENIWGSLSEQNIRLLKNEGYSSLKDLADEFEDSYTGTDSLSDLRSQLAILIAEKSRLTIRSEISDKDEEIKALEGEDGLITIKSETVKDELAKKINKWDFEFIDVKKNDAVVEDAINLLFNEVDFFWNYNKWGDLPLRIIGILESETSYKSLQDMIYIHILDSNDPDIRESGAAGLQDVLESVIGEDGSGNIYRLLNDTEVKFIIDSTIILSSPGEAQLNQVGRAVANTIKNIAGALAIIWIIIAGARMIFARGDENTITEQKRAILWGVIGLLAILLTDRMIDVLYGPAGNIRTELVLDQGFSDEIYGIVTFLKAIIGMIAIFFIVLSGIKTVFASGEEDKITQQRKSVLWVVIGLILIAIDQILVENFFIIPTQLQSDRIETSNVVSIINITGSVLKFTLGFVGLITFGILIYGAATMVMNYGNDEMVQKSKKIIKNAIIGILVILSAYVIVASLVVFQ